MPNYAQTDNNKARQSQEKKNLQVSNWNAASSISSSYPHSVSLYQSQSHPHSHSRTRTRKPPKLLCCFPFLAVSSRFSWLSCFARVLGCLLKSSQLTARSLDRAGQAKPSHSGPLVKVFRPGPYRTGSLWGSVRRGCVRSLCNLWQTPKSVAIESTLDVS